MSGTRAGAAKAAAKNKELYGNDYYKKIGQSGGKASNTGGFYYSMANGLNWHREAGAKGGRISRRGKKVSA